MSDNEVAEIQNVEESPEMSNDFESDDEFGEFGEFEEGNEQNDNVETEPPCSTSAGPIDIRQDEIEIYNGDYESASEKISHLVSRMLKVTPEAEEEDTTIGEACQFKFDERAAKIFDSLVAEEDGSRRMFIWRQSMIHEQLLLNLDLSETKHNTTTMKRGCTSANTTNSAHTRDLYDFSEAADETEHVQIVRKQVPEFSTLNLDKNGDEFSRILSDTDSILTQAHNLLQKEGNETSDSVEKLIKTKQELVKLLSVWDERAKDVKADNELFTSYIENLIGNTQKLRRESRKAAWKRKK
jgi:hypothetical protein